MTRDITAGAKIKMGNSKLLVRPTKSLIPLELSFKLVYNPYKQDAEEKDKI